MESGTSSTSSYYTGHHRVNLRTWRLLDMSATLGAESVCFKGVKHRGLW